jgi:hypothetical protein
MKQMTLPLSSYLKALQSEKSPSRSIACARALPRGRAVSARARRRGAKSREADLVGMVQADGMLLTDMADIIEPGAGAATP